MTAHTHAYDTGTSLTPDSADSWLAATSVRHSRRRFDGSPAETALLDSLEAVCTAFRPHPDARVVLARDPGDGIFKGVVGSYGKVTGAAHVLLFVADERSAASHAHLGYTGEAAVLQATVLGLQTCWVGGFFNPRRVNRLIELGPGERVVAVSPVGRAEGSSPAGAEAAMVRMAGAHARKPLDVIAPGLAEDTWPAWARAAAECVRVAPSAMNRQPWRLRLEGGELVVSRDTSREAPRVTRALDCGIAMLHAELGAFGEGVRGRWTDLGSGLDVARFTPQA